MRLERERLTLAAGRDRAAELRGRHPAHGERSAFEASARARQRRGRGNAGSSIVCFTSQPPRRIRDAPPTGGRRASVVSQGRKQKGMIGMKSQITSAANPIPSRDVADRLLSE
jgi:hypothetical protein